MRLLIRFYYGVGGGTDLFEAFCEEKGVFEVEEAKKIDDKKSNQRLILRLRFKK